jgi:site-specific DNA-methyltransferase (adenine-specific)
MGTLYYGDNLDILRRYIKDEAVDFVCLAPAFNSKHDNSFPFKAPNGEESKAPGEANME